MNTIIKNKNKYKFRVQIPKILNFCKREQLQYLLLFKGQTLNTEKIINIQKKYLQNDSPYNKRVTIELRITGNDLFTKEKILKNYLNCCKFFKISRSDFLSYLLIFYYETEYKISNNKEKSDYFYQKDDAGYIKIKKHQSLEKKEVVEIIKKLEEYKMLNIDVNSKILSFDQRKENRKKRLDLAKEYNVSEETIKKIEDGKSWKNIFKKEKDIKDIKFLSIN